MKKDDKTVDRTRTNSIESRPVNDDALRLAQMGHKQELARQYSLPALCALCVCLMASWEALATVVATALNSGGAPCLFYNLLLSTVFSIFIASSLGEIASIFPTAGGQYHWVAALSPLSIRSPLAFMTGWISIGGQIVLTSAAAFAAGLQVQSLIIMNDDSYVPQRWQGMLFYWAILIYALVINIWGHRLLPMANLISGVIHVTGFIAILVVLGVMAPKNSASFVFVEVTNSSGWPNGVSWLVGLLSAVFPYLGYDAACHLAEEMPNASRNVPLAMVGSVCINGVMSVIFAVILLFSTGPLESLLQTPTGFPFMQIFLDTTKTRAGASVISLVITVIAIAAAVAGITSTSRTLWAFARDKSTPFDKYLSKVNNGLQIPIHAVVLVTVLQMLLGFIYLGNTTAFNATLSMAVIGNYFSYAIPITQMLWARGRVLSSNDYGPFKLGPVIGPLTNIISLVWIGIVIIFSVFPAILPVTPQNMNYSIVVMAGWILFGTMYYIFFGRYKFEVAMVGDVDGVPV